MDPNTGKLYKIGDEDGEVTEAEAAEHMRRMLTGSNTAFVPVAEREVEKVRVMDRAGRRRWARNRRKKLRKKAKRERAKARAKTRR